MMPSPCPPSSRSCNHQRDLPMVMRTKERHAAPPRPFGPTPDPADLDVIIDKMEKEDAEKAKVEVLPRVAPREVIMAVGSPPSPPRLRPVQLPPSPTVVTLGRAAMAAAPPPLPPFMPPQATAIAIAAPPNRPPNWPPRNPVVKLGWFAWAAQLLRNAWSWVQGLFRRN